MWEDNASNSSIPPQLLKDFDVYGLLQPQRAEDSFTPLVDLGIGEATNLTDSFATIAHSSNKEFTPIDLYENLFVTPDLVTNKPSSDELSHDFFTKHESEQRFWATNERNTSCSTNDSMKTQSNSLNARMALEVDALFDDVRNKEKTDNFSKTLRSDREEDTEDLIDSLILAKALSNVTISEPTVPKELGNIKVLKTPNIKLDCKENQQVNKPTNNMQSDVLDGLKQARGSQSKMESSNFEIKTLSTPNTRKCTLGLNTTPILTSDRVLSNLRVCNISKIPVQNSETPKTSNILVQNLTSPITPNVIRNLTSPRTSNILEQNLTSPKTSNVRLQNLASSKTSYFPAHNLASPENSNVLVQNLASLKIYLDERRRKFDAECVRKPNSKINILNMPVSPGGLRALPQQTMIKDPKVFAKKRIFISDSQKLNYCKGPSFDEKRLLMPSLLQRLEKHKEEMEARNSVQKRPLLSVGDFKNLKVPSISIDPVVLTDDCNRDRLVAFKTRKAIKILINENNP